MASDSEPEKFFSVRPPTPSPLGSRFQPQLTPLENTETFKITNKIAFIMIDISQLSHCKHIKHYVGPGPTM